MTYPRLRILEVFTQNRVCTVGLIRWYIFTMITGWNLSMRLKLPFVLEFHDINGETTL
jgi:hypothetical protein